MIRTAIVAAALALSPPAQAWSYYLLPPPWTKICDQSDQFDSYLWPPGEIQFVCRQSDGHKYIGLELSRDCAPFYIEHRGDGWYRITCHLVME